jgi:hypothetical protein
MGAPTLDFEPWPPPRLLPAPLQSSVAIVMLGIWALAVLLLPMAAIGTAALIAAAAMAFIATLAYRYPQWRIFALLLIVETLPSANFLPITDAQRPCCVILYTCCSARRCCRGYGARDSSLRAVSDFTQSTLPGPS